MTLTCPCCKATNETATCRRCKADLSLMADLERQRDHLLDRARRMTQEGDLHRADQFVRNADILRRDAQSIRMQALLGVINRHCTAAESRTDG